MALADCERAIELNAEQRGRGIPSNISLFSRACAGCGLFAEETLTWDASPLRSGGEVVVRERVAAAVFCAIQGGASRLFLFGEGPAVVGVAFGMGAGDGVAEELAGAVEDAAGEAGTFGEVGDLFGVDGVLAFGAYGVDCCPS